jgi:hypothetical protein
VVPEVTRLRIATGVWMLTACSVATSDEGSLRLNGAIEATREQILQRCSSSDLSTPNTMSATTEELFAKSGAEKFLNCECVPQRLAVIAASDAANRNGTLKEAEELLRTAVTACGALMTRKYFVPICVEAGGQKPDPSIKDVQGLCDCMGAEYAKFSDEQIVEDSVAAYRDYEAQVQARKDGKPRPAAFESLIEPIEQACRAKQPQVPRAKAP